MIEEERGGEVGQWPFTSSSSSIQSNRIPRRAAPPKKKPSQESQREEEGAFFPSVERITHPPSSGSFIYNVGKIFDFFYHLSWYDIKLTEPL